MKGTLIIAAALLAAANLQAGDKHPFTAKGLYSEACSCRPPCRCELFGLKKGCEGVGALQLTGGTYDGTDLTGLKAAYATEPGNWVRIYIQAANDEQRKAGAAFLTAVYSGFGKVEEVKDAKVEIANDNGNFTVSVDGEKIMKYETKAYLGGDKKTPVTYTNIPDPLNSVFKQGISESATYKDGGHEITLDKGRNAFFNDEMNSSGEI
jgi:hypothetical protein